MAGDLPLVEDVIVLPERIAGVNAVKAFARSATPNTILHEFGPRVRIAGAPPGSQAAAALSPVPKPEYLPQPSDIDPVGALGLQAFRLRSSQSYAAAKSNRPLASSPWDKADAAAPDRPDASNAAAAAAFASPSRARPSQPMRGRLGVGLVLVEGPTADLTFTPDEQTYVVAEVQNALSWLGSNVPYGNIVWSYDIQTVRLGVAPDPSIKGFDALEALWRDPALAALGYQATMPGVEDYLAALLARLGLDRAYCAFFTKYPVGHFAYASLGGPHLVMQYENDGWTPSNIDRVFAHESCHIFGAPDEYAASGCNCKGAWGASGGPNANCERCAKGGAVPCIMLKNDWSLCSATPGHLGW
ncbi:MAG: hypothetical protein ACRDOH_04850 [Streptosporangiaceae bacterium]